MMLSDFGVAFCPAKMSRFESYTSLQTRPLEARFDTKNPLSFVSDIWGIGCAMWEILGSRSLLDCFLYFLFTEDNAMGDQIDVFGPLPPE
ncbi:hypothetical protein F4860DRAFT_457522 [Xylaria cubensis]|nr:hypothetical protein F4860DRAFT_457522 [Xylaria cubensis]